MSFQTITASHCAELTELAMRSKAHWGYDAAFMDACRDELTLYPHHLADRPGCAWWEDGKPQGFYQLLLEPDTYWIELLYVDPNHMGKGLGRRIFDAAVEHARGLGARSLQVVADPHALGFYQAMGGVPSGDVPSGSIPNRFLPKLTIAVS